MFKIDDWVFCEFELQQVKAVENGRVQEVSTGVMNHSGFDLTDRCVPLTMPMKRIADTFQYFSQRIHREGSAGLNYPDIHRWLVLAWQRACARADDSEALTSAFKEAGQFMEDVLRKQDVESGYGFPLLRAR